ncbi:calcium-binding protein [Acidovorax sp. K2F]|uniref:calcium-binding protein n=1 Tax=Acidovorax sp. K2F TaxID=2978125 RepID=UPI0021B09EB7|nr:calcium-binding protein [Acidovorax sp. K2F]MCT6721621.1 hypothetical protein [Acidovorax sp. K2F]
MSISSTITVYVHVAAVGVGAADNLVQTYNSASRVETVAGYTQVAAAVTSSVPGLGILTNVVALTMSAVTADPSGATPGQLVSAAGAMVGIFASALATAGIVVPALATVGTVLTIGGAVYNFTQLAKKPREIVMQGPVAAWNDAMTMASPLVLDLDGDGVETQSREAGIHFDHGGDGFAENTGWSGSDDGFLVRDLNGDGQITSGRELFGNQTLLNNGQAAANGFVALSQLDTNGDGLINAGDTDWSTLRIWKDSNGNGISEANELLSLSDAGVGGINLNYTNQGGSAAIDANGNAHRQVGAYTDLAGASRAISDVWFSTVNWDTDDRRTPLPLDIDIQTLPEIVGPGVLGSLQQAMARDVSGALQSAVELYIGSSNVAERSSLINEILYRWAGVYGLSPTSRGPIDDARKLAFLESAFGEGFIQNGVSTNPGWAAVGPLQNIYNNFQKEISARLDMSGLFKPLYDEVRISYNEADQKITLDVSRIEVDLRQRFNQNAESALVFIEDFSKNLIALGLQDIIQAIHAAGDPLGDLVDQQLFWIGQTIGSDAAAVMYGVTGIASNIHGKGGNDTIFGANMNDVLFGGDGDDYVEGAEGNDIIDGGRGTDQLSGGSGDDRIFGGEGNDFLNGGDGDDILDGGIGSDTLQGGGGNDTYLYSAGSGSDILYEEANRGDDTLRLGDGITPSSTKITRGGSGFSDLILSFGGADTITIRGYFQNNNDGGRIENIVFSDGTSWNFAAVADRLTTQGTAAADTIFAIAGVDNRINGLGGDDIIYGSGLNDELYGGDGNDYLSGDAGNDKFFGGSGNDGLQGGIGNDTYFFNLGDANDTIYESTNQGEDIIRLGDGINPSSTQITRGGSGFSDLILSFGGVDTITIRGYFQNNSDGGRIENIIFSNGTSWNFSAVADRLITQGTAAADTIFAIAGIDNRINGLGGDDIIYGSGLNDELYGGDGNDYLSGDAGNDKFFGGSGTDGLQGSAGNDTYFYNLGDGNDTIYEYNNSTDNLDVAIFGNDISTDQLWFRQVGYHLEISVIGRDQSLTVSNWYLGGSYRVERFVTNNGLILNEGSVQGLVQAMSGFAPPSTGQTNLPPSYQASLAPIIAASWQ